MSPWRWLHPQLMMSSRPGPGQNQMAQCGKGTSRSSSGRIQGYVKKAVAIGMQPMPLQRPPPPLMRRALQP